MPPIVVYDACVLYPAPLRDLLLRIAVAGLVRARWSRTILDECFRNIIENRPELSLERLARTRNLMNRAVPDCLVTDFEHLIDEVALPDPDDRHVLAAAIHAAAEAIVTFNTSDFPRAALAPHHVETWHPDDFLCSLLETAPTAVVRVLRDQASALSRPRRSPLQLLPALGASGVPRAAAILRDLLYPT